MGLNHDFLLLDREVLTLTGQFSWTAENAPALPDGYERAAQLQGGYDRLELERDPLVSVMRQLAEHARQVRSVGGRLYLLHIGI